MKTWWSKGRLCEQCEGLGEVLCDCERRRRRRLPDTRVVNPDVTPCDKCFAGLRECPDCKGRTYHGSKFNLCKTCEGSGIVICDCGYLVSAQWISAVELFGEPEDEDCPICHGRGYMTCRSCGGTRRQKRTWRTVAKRKAERKTTKLAR